MTNDDNDTPKRAKDDHAHKPEVCKCIDLFSVVSNDLKDPRIVEARDTFVKEVDEYLRIFAKPIMEGPEGNQHSVCLHCGEGLTGLHSMFFSKGGFQWGLVHGEGFCAACGWPGRGAHYPKKEDGTDLLVMSGTVLQYLPDFVTSTPPEDCH